MKLLKRILVFLWLKTKEIGKFLFWLCLIGGGAGGVIWGLDWLNIYMASSSNVWVVFFSSYFYFAALGLLFGAVIVMAIIDMGKWVGRWLKENWDQAGNIVNSWEDEK